MSEKEKNLGGRPTTYKPEYCERLIEHMSEGLSFESFCGVVECAKDTLYNWARANPEFARAKEIAFEKCRLFWERVGISGATGANKDFNATSWIFNMKNRFYDEWRDKQEVEQSGTVLLGAAGRRELAQMAEEARLLKLEEDRQKLLKSGSDEDE